MEKRGRKKGTKNRDKAEIQAERENKTIRSEWRKNKGLPERGRLTKDQEKELELYLSEKSNLTEDLIN